MSKVSPSPPDVFSSLPAELHEAILSHCDVPTLATISRVSFACLELTSKLLYEDITVTTVDQIIKLFRLSPCSPPEQPSSTSARVSQHTSLSLIHSLTFHASSATEYSLDCLAAYRPFPPPIALHALIISVPMRPQSIEDDAHDSDGGSINSQSLEDEHSRMQYLVELVNPVVLFLRGRPNLPLVRSEAYEEPFGGFAARIEVVWPDWTGERPVCKVEDQRWNRLEVVWASNVIPGDTILGRDSIQRHAHYTVPQADTDQQEQDQGQGQTQDTVVATPLPFRLPPVLIVDLVDLPSASTPNVPKQEVHDSSLFTSVCCLQSSPYGSQDPVVVLVGSDAHRLELEQRVEDSKNKRSSDYDAVGRQVTLRTASERVRGWREKMVGGRVGRRRMDWEALEEWGSASGTEVN